MEQQPTPREQTHGRAGTKRTPDRWLWIGSLVFHLIVFLLLPTFSTQAKQPLQLLIEIVRPEVKRQPVKPSGVKNPIPATNSSSQPVEQHPAEPPASLSPESAELETPAIKPNEVNPAPDELQQTQADAATTAPIPEMVAVPTHQPLVIPLPADPVVEEEKPEPSPEPVPAPPTPVEAETPAPQKQPTLPVPPSSSGNTEAQAKQAEDEETTPEVPARPDGGSIDPAPSSGTPAANIPGQPDSGEEESAGPPGPSALELGMLGDYGDGARKKIRMLVRTPELAREQGLKGKCKFEFELRSDGTLVGIKIVESSSHPVLDEECLEATRVAAPFKRFPRGVSVESWKFQMEIVFPTY